MLLLPIMSTTQLRMPTQNHEFMAICGIVYENENEENKREVLARMKPAATNRYSLLLLWTTI